VVIPASLLRQEGTVSPEDLPFDVKLDEYMVNSALTKEVPANAHNLATDGAGQQTMAVKRPEVSGTDASQKSDVASAYVTFIPKGSGKKQTYLVSQWLDPQPLRVGKKAYQVSLRAKRLYKPYTIQALKLTHKSYIGTNKPKEYSSEVLLTDPSRKEKREVVISMNDPLRYHGETFYQSGFVDADPREGRLKPITTFQVVRNPGWLMPYISCVMVALGMLVHFTLCLIKFLAQEQKKASPISWGPGLLGKVATIGGLLIGVFSQERQKNSLGNGETGAHDFGRFFPALVVLLTGGLLVFLAVPSSEADDQMHFDQYARLPVVMDGRVKPNDTVARNALMSLSHRQVFKDEHGQYQPAIKWLLDVMVSGRMFSKDNGPAQKHQVFRINDLDVLKLLGLKRKPGFYRYSIDEFQDKFEVLDNEAKRVRETPEDDRDAFDVKILHLYKQVQLYIELSEFLEPRTLPDLKDPEQDWKPFLAGFRGLVRDVMDFPADDRGAQALKNVLQAYAQKDRKTFFRALADYRKLPDAERKVENDLAISQFALLVAYKDGNTKAFNRELNAYQDLVDQHLPKAARKASFEVFYNRLDPMTLCAFLYLLVVLLGCLSWLTWGEPLRRAALWLGLLIVILHVLSLLGRMYILGRPLVFVTNLYSSAIFIGCACAILGLILEGIFKNGLAIVAGALLGFGTLLLAPTLGGEGDNLQMMEAVLDTNFWLATHVTVVTMGYTATYLAGTLGLAYIVLGVFTPRLDRELAKKLSQMIYGVLCFATLTSFTGTVLGGIWADQSWGRFWGWDPKENGALLVVLWNALILHARWAGIVKQQGIAVLTVVGIMITTWSWIGTNQLGIGLHAYGFNKALVQVAQLLWLGSIVFLIVGLMPRHWWWSNRIGKYTPPPVKPL
jgi:ABC-type transport system involved in cytochrome c biogenesis permease subunit